MEQPSVPEVETLNQSSTDPPELQSKDFLKSQREVPALQREEPALQREQLALLREKLQMPTLQTKAPIPPLPSEYTQTTISTQPTCIHQQPSRFDHFDVKYGFLAAISAYFA